MNEQPQVAAVLVAADVMAGLQQYLFTRPYSEVAQFIQVLGQSAALNNEQVAWLQSYVAPGTEVDKDAKVDEKTETDEKPSKKDK